MFRHTDINRNGLPQTVIAAPRGYLWLRAQVVAVWLLVMVGCQAAPTPTPLPPPTPTPAATPTLDLSATLEDLSGWWKLSTSTDSIVHVEPDGTWSLFYGSTRPQAWRVGPGSQGSWQPAGDRWEMRYTRGLLMPDCFANVGQYDIQLLSADSFQAIRIKDLCDFGAENYTWTRATQFEPLPYTWVAEGQPDAAVALRSDMRYAAWRGDNPETGQVVWGDVVWDHSTGQVQLKDKAASPCGPSKVGLYKVTIGADGKAAFECVEDLCEQRRQALTQWGPFHRSDTYKGIAGRYVCVAQPQYELLLTACGTQRLRQLPDEGKGLLHQGTLAIQEAKLRFLDTLGDASCGKEAGTYAFSLDGNTLKLETATDACQARKELVAACSTWTRVGSE